MRTVKPGLIAVFIALLCLGVVVVVSGYAGADSEDVIDTPKPKKKKGKGKKKGKKNDDPGGDAKNAKGKTKGKKNDAGDAKGGNEPEGGKNRMKATYHSYDESGPLVATACQSNGPDVFVKPALLKRHHWTAVNPASFGISNDWADFTKRACGKLVRVTSSKGKTEEVVIVDQKGDEGLDLSPQAYEALGLSVADGHEYVQAVLLG